MVAVSFVFALGLFALASSARAPAAGPLLLAVLIALVGLSLGAWLFFRGSG